MCNNLKNINVTVVKQTAEALKTYSKHLDLTEGEILDRLIPNVRINDSKKAAACVCDYLAMVIKNQTDEQVRSTLLYLISFCIASISGNAEWTSNATTETLKDLEKTYKSIREFLNTPDK